MSFAAKIVAAEASGQVTGEPAAAWPAGPGPPTAVRAAAGGPNTTEQAGGMPGGHEARPALLGRPGMAAHRGRAGPDPDGPAGKESCQSRQSVNRQRNGLVERL